MGNRFARWVLVVSLPLTALAGCGGQDRTAGEPAPELGQELGRIDDSIAAGRYARAREAIDALVEATSQARQAGDLGTAQADDIAAAAARLRAALPAIRPSRPEATEQPTASPTPRADDEVEHEEGDHKEHGKGHGKGHKDD